MKVRGSTLLAVTSVASLAIAVLHLAIIAIGAPGYLYFGAVGLAEAARQGSLSPAIQTSCITVLFLVFAWYAHAGAGGIPRPPLLRAGLVLIGSIYSLRGIVLVLDIARLVRNAGYPVRQTVFSGVALVIGLLYLVGAARRWGELGNAHERVAG